MSNTGEPIPWTSAQAAGTPSGQSGGTGNVAVVNAAAADAAGRRDEAQARHWPMRYSVHLGIRSKDEPLFKESVGSADPVAQIDYAADLGFEAVFDNQLKARDISEQERIGAALQRRGLALSSFVNNPVIDAPVYWGIRDADMRSAIRYDVRSSIEAARRVGARVINLASPLSKQLPRRRQLANLADNLKDVAFDLECAGLTMVIEPASEMRAAGLLLRTLDEALEVAKRVRHPAVRVMFDTYHVFAETGEIDLAFINAQEWIGTVQIGDFPTRAQPGSGMIDFPRFFATLEQCGYPGYLELEFFCTGEGKAGEAAALAALADLRPLEPSHAASMAKNP